MQPIPVTVLSGFLGAGETAPRARASGPMLRTATGHGAHDAPALPLPLDAGRHRFVDELGGLDAIAGPALNLCVWPREPHPDYAAWLDAACASMHLAVEALLPTVRPDASALVEALPSHRWRDTLRRDIEALTRCFGRCTGGALAGVQLSTVHTDKCRRYHADFVGLRLLCTYSGPGTEWVPEPGVDRGRGADLVRDASAIRALARFDVAVLKGNAWPGNEGGGCIHRSPPIEGCHGRRLLLKIDAA